MTLTIWVDDWQIQCCGQSFAPGDVVSWTLLEVDPEDYADVVGSERADEIDFREEHHGQADEHTRTSVEVMSIAEVHCRYEVPPGATDKVNHPVPGTTVLVPVKEADGWAKARPDVRFAGYLVTARHAADEPGRAAARGR
ncbi:MULTISPECIES: DUF6578 domain-containing protein [Streptomyces]|uniref:Uncharacterized protein n=1 Tax=Streptomyces scabiei (strain 87.22) TaxID=680198 RepID=C9Z5L0_STRSW|nr:DUF6578 domain-containing protein [Streptomyces scabiei]MDX2578340.1 hypothetical protein [Streptomyces scabiei]MDX2657652.1 hypothetical protein [Streptomyces scabiei]MDX2723954.1 hypothetical protein [Streptomyces scabiei]MDX2831592.1 hypothetical protein [Streptomyces scabiei]MDX2869292.1 hypothetical protein [Streptomyces scabiei]